VGEPFKDILIFYDGLGNTNVSWVLDSRFDDPFPHVFALEFCANEAGFEANEYLTIAEGNNVVQLSDSVFRTAGMTNTAFYRVRLTTSAGKYYSPIKCRQISYWIIARITKKRSHIIQKGQRGSSWILI